MPARTSAQRRAVFKRCKTPASRAECDVDLFLEYYFLTDGQPDPSKTPEPLILPGIRAASISFESRDIPGLSTCHGGDWRTHTAVVGWGYGAVEAVAKRITEEVERAEKEKREEIWSAAMEKHHQYMSSQPSDGSALPIRTIFDLHLCKGSYVMRCDRVMQEWPKDMHFTLNIATEAGDIMIAAFDFGVVEGDMLLCLSEDRLKEITGEEDDSEDDSEDEESIALARERDKQDPSTHRVYYRMSGRETFEGETFCPKAGHLDFSSDGRTSFDGLAHFFPYLDTNVQFQGFRVADAPRQLPGTKPALSWVS